MNRQERFGELALLGVNIHSELLTSGLAQRDCQMICGPRLCVRNSSWSSLHYINVEAGADQYSFTHWTKFRRSVTDSTAHQYTLLAPLLHWNGVVERSLRFPGRLHVQTNYEPDSVYPMTTLSSSPHGTATQDSPELPQWLGAWSESMSVRRG